MHHPAPPLAEPFSQIFVDQAEAGWAFDLLRDTAKRLGIHGPYDPRFALTLAHGSGRLGLHLIFGNWLVLGFHGPGPSPPRVEIALLAQAVSWDERLSVYPSVQKEGEPEVRSYQLPLEIIRPMTSDLQTAYETTLDFIAQKFQNWKRATPWKLHNPEIAEGLFNLEQRERLFAGLLEEAELRYERHLTAFYQDLSEEPEAYETDEIEPRGEAGEEAGEEIEAGYLLERTNHMNLIQERQEIQYNAQIRLAEPFSQIFVDREEADWAFNLLRQAFERLGIKNPDDPRFALTLARRYGGLNLHFNLGNWLVLGFRGQNLRRERIRIPLFTENEQYAEGLSLHREHDFAQGVGEQAVTAYGLPIERVKSFDNNLQRVYGATLDYIAERFQDYGRCPWRNRYHVSEIAEAVFDLEKRKKLLTEGLSLEIAKVMEQEAELNLPYPLPQLAEDTGFEQAELARWVRAIERKGQAILYGPPGTGKTFIAEKLAQHLVGGGDGFWDLVQFHPAYAYEDFMQGIRPQSEDGRLSYPLVPGRFLEFCARARQRQGRCILIVDEINRANLSRVFGELMYLLEYRRRDIPLAGGGFFQIPANVRLIGTMNTADRSIALVDHALRRRFAFLALYPNYELLRRYHQRQQTGFPVEGLIAVLQRLNRQIDDPHYAVGVTFFLTPHLADDLEDIWRMEIEPYLEEYFFDQPGKVDDFRWAAIQSKVAP